MASGTQNNDRERVLIAVGGNALYDKEGGDNLDKKKVKSICKNIVNVVKQGYLPIVTFGNGPQVGNLLNMAETSARLYSSQITLATCVSWTQGQMGYWLANELNKQLIQASIDLTVMPTITSVEVDPNDPAFENPSKPIGHFITEEVAQRLYVERGWKVGPDANRGYRRMVPSPKPKRIVEAPAINNLIDSNTIVLCCGGGGVPVYRTPDGLKGIEAVIDKDYTSCLLAKTLQIENLIICTEVEYVYLNFGTPEQKAIRQLSLAEAQTYLKDGQFSEGSMGPKVAALIDYVEHGGKRAIITSIPKMTKALAGDTGTEIYQ